MKRFGIFILFSIFLSASAQVNFASQNNFTLAIPGQEDCHGSLFVIEKDKGILDIQIRDVDGKKIITNGEFIWQLAITQLPRLDCVTGVIRNISGRQLLLEPGIKLQVPRQNGDFY
jgi:hypothetical protein